MHAFVGRAAAPTVTLPRLKALTTGALPGFLDALHNFDAARLAVDSWPRLARRANRTLVLHGDDTWLRILGATGETNTHTTTTNTHTTTTNTHTTHTTTHTLTHEGVFARVNPVSSFDVRDSVIVDANITRHIDAEIENCAHWDILVLHFLGLDHIGHCEGAWTYVLCIVTMQMYMLPHKCYSYMLPHKCYSYRVNVTLQYNTTDSTSTQLFTLHNTTPRTLHPLNRERMLEKQREMDDVFRKLHTRLPANTLLVLLGDHGMTNVSVLCTCSSWEWWGTSALWCSWLSRGLNTAKVLSSILGGVSLLFLELVDLWGQPSFFGSVVVDFTFTYWNGVDFYPLLLPSPFTCSFYL